MDKNTLTVIKQFISTKQAAERLGVGRLQAARLIREGKIEGVRIGGTWIVYAPSLRNYLKTKDPRGHPPSGKPTQNESTI
jgi:excisionase family DNA binding protein